MSYNDRQDSATRAGGMAGGGTSNGNRAGGKSNGSNGNAGLSRDQITAMVLGRPAPGPAPAGPAPTFGHNDGPQGPRPGTGDRWGTTIGQNPEIQRQQSLYNAAADNMQNRGFGGWLEDNLKNFVPGFHQKTPQWNKPSTYAEGIYHDAWSPLAAALGLAATAAPVPLSGAVAGRVGIAATDALDLPDYTFGAGGGWRPDETNAIETAYGKPQTPYGPADPTKALSLGNPTQGGMSAFPSLAPGGAPFGPQPGAVGNTSAPALAPSAGPGIGRLPNHSLPYGYTSLFPNSLSEQDKALLYANALNGVVK